MKKFLSMLLVLTMVVTTLMGVMVTNVSAADPTAPTKTSVNTTADENSVESRKVIIQMGSQYIPTASTNVDSKIGNTLGSIYVQGYDYGNTTLTAEGVTSMVAEGTTEPAHIADVSRVTFGNMNGIKTDWKAATIKDETAKTQAAKVTANYIRLMPTAIDLGKTNGLGGTAFKNIVASDHAKLTTSNVLKVTLYGYTQNADTENGKSICIVGAASNSETGAAKIGIFNATQIASEKGIPHKIDLVYTTDGETSPVYSLNVFVDGISVSSGKSSAGGYKDKYITTNLYTNLGLDAATFSGSLTTGDTDWVMFYDTVNQTEFELVDRAEFESGLIIKPTYTSVSNTYRTDDYITGVIDTLDASIKAVLETTKTGDKVVDIYESNYNNPASLFNSTDSTVKLIRRTTGEEVAVADATGTMADYYFMVNGVYVMANKVDDPADPARYLKHTKDPFSVSTANHGKILARVLQENYEVNAIPDNEPAYGGLRSGFLRYTNEPRVSLTFSSGGAYYNQDGYYGLNMPGTIKTDNATYGSVPKKLTTLEFDMYAPEYTYASGKNIRLLLSGWQNDASTGNKDKRAELPTVYFTTNGKASGSVPATTVDLVGNAWNSVSIQFDATNTPTTGKLDIIVYVNGEKQLETQSGALYAATAENCISFIEFARLYMPAYTSVAIMNDAWYIGDYVPTAREITENVIDAASVSGVSVSIDNESNLIAYDNTGDADYAKLIAAMEAAGYNAVYEQVVDAALVDAKYDEVDGSEAYKSSDLTHTGKLIKKWIESPLTDAYVVNNGDTDSDGKNEYTIKDANITAAVDNGDTATITVTKDFTVNTYFAGIAHTTDEIVASLAEEGKVGRTKVLVGFAPENEAGKLPRVYSLQEPGTELYALAYDEATKTAALTYREFAGTDTIPFVMVVAAYNDKGKLLVMDISETITIDSANEADGIKTKTFTADFGELDLTTVRKYKVFVFDSITSGIAKMQNLSVANSAYVAPQN